MQIERGGMIKANIQSYMSGAAAWRRMKEKEKRIQTPFDRFNTGGMTLSAYLSAIMQASFFNTGLLI